MSCVTEGLKIKSESDFNKISISFVFVVIKKESKLVLEPFFMFPTVVFNIKLPQFLEAAKTVVNEAIEQKRKEIKRLLSLLTDKNRNVFMHMYSHYDLEKPIDEVVDDMPAKNLSWALTQCQNSYYNIFKILQS